MGSYSCSNINVLVVLILASCADGPETCRQGSWGSICDKTCPANCDEEESTKEVYCDKDTGYCAEGCIAGYYKPNCDEQCQDCTSGRCVQVDGACLPGGVSGVLHPNTFLVMLCMLIPISGNRLPVTVITLTLAYQVTYADACSCTHCKDLQCDHSGNCLHSCADSHNYGPKCQYECPNNCINLRCMVATNGQPNCTAGCKDGFWGTGCTIPCSPRCQRCNGPETCLSCNSHYFGTDCQSDCIEKCNGKSCNPDGSCRTDTCADGWYGPDCTIECPATCKTCDKVMGTCTRCQVEWYGLDCADICPLSLNSTTFCLKLLDTDSCHVCTYKDYVNQLTCGGPSMWNPITSVGLLCLSTFTVLALTTT